MIKVLKLENAILFPQFILDKKLLSLIEYEKGPNGKNNNIYHYATGINLYEINYLFSISKKTNLSKIKLEKNIIIYLLFFKWGTRSIKVVNF